MTAVLEAVAGALVGAWSRAEAAAAAGLALDEFDRLLARCGPGAPVMTPIAVDLDAQTFEFLAMNGVSFDRPFFDDTVAEARARSPAPLNVQTTATTLLDAAAREQGADAAGLIFHAGRCGSTLLANMLCADGGCLVVREPDLVSDLLAAWLRAGEDQIEGRAGIELWLSAAAPLLMHRAARACGRADLPRLLKLSAWNIGAAQPLLRVFPDVPAIFLYRDPLHTVASMLESPPAWADLRMRAHVVQSHFFPSLRQEGQAPSPAVLFAHAWRSAVEAAFGLEPERLLFVAYERLVQAPEATLARICIHLRRPQDDRRLARMALAAERYSKDAAATFDPKGRHRRPPLDPSTAETVRAITAHTWARLGALEEAAHGWP